MIARLATRFLERLRLSIPSLPSWRVQRSLLGVFLEFLEEAGVDEPSELAPELLTSFRTALFYRTTRFGTPPSARFQASVVTTVRAFLAYLLREGYLLSDLASSLPAPRIPKRLPPGGLSRAEAERLLEAPDPKTLLGARDRAILETLYATGLRASELLHLKLSDFEGSSDAPLLRVVRGKGGKDRLVPLGSAAHRACSVYLERARPRFPRAAHSPVLFLSWRGKPLDDDALNSLIARHAKTAKLSRHITAHSLRHTCATLMLKAGCDIRYIQALLGHASLATTQLYTKVDISDLARAHARFHPRSFPRPGAKPRPPAERFSRGRSPWGRAGRRP